MFFYHLFPVVNFSAANFSITINLILILIIKLFQLYFNLQFFFKYIFT